RSPAGAGAQPRPPRRARASWPSLLHDARQLLLGPEEELLALVAPHHPALGHAHRRIGARQALDHASHAFARRDLGQLLMQVAEGAALSVRCQDPAADIEPGRLVLGTRVVALGAILAQDEGDAARRPRFGDKTGSRVVAAFGICIALFVGRALQEPHEGALEGTR